MRVEKIKRAAELIDAVYQHKDCGAGGYAHVVIDDWNLDDYFIDSGIKDAEEHPDPDVISEEGRLACLRCLKYLKELSLEEREAAMCLYRREYRDTW